MHNMIISASSLNNLQLCMRKFYYEKVLKISPIYKSAALEKGDLMHVLLESYYRSKQEMIINRLPAAHLPFIIKACIDTGRAHADSLNLTAEESELIISYFKQYIVRYKDETWIPMTIEEPFSKILFESEELDLRVIVEGKLDLSVRENGKIILVDHKTKSQNKKVNELSNQFMMYCYVFDNLTFISNNIVYVKDPDKQFSRSVLMYSPEQIHDWYLNTCSVLIDAFQKIQNNIFPQNFTSCDKFGLCSFYSICSKASSDRDYEIKGNYREAKSHDIFAIKNEEVKEGNKNEGIESKVVKGGTELPS